MKNELRKIKQIKMLKVLLFSVAATVFFVVSIYTLNYTDIDGNTKSMGLYQGKKIFIVNTATASANAGQFSELEQLYQMHKDSMVVIAFASNTFGHEPRTNAEIKNYVQSTYGVTFPLAAKCVVKGDTACALYKWLLKVSDNGVMNTRVKGDFQKYLIDKTGNLVAVFDSSTHPMDAIIQQAIQGN